MTDLIQAQGEAGLLEAEIRSLIKERIDHFEKQNPGLFIKFNSFTGSPGIWEDGIYCNLEIRTEKQRG